MTTCELGLSKLLGQRSSSVNQLSLNTENLLHWLKSAQLEGNRVKWAEHAKKPPKTTPHTHPGLKAQLTPTSGQI